jgi:hypothetical protein
VSPLPVECCSSADAGWQRRRTLGKVFAYLLFLDCAFSALWRFAFLEYVIGSHFADLCRRSDGRIGHSQSCGTPFGVVHAATAFVLFVVTFSEVLLADAVRKYARDLAGTTGDEEDTLPPNDVKSEEYVIDLKT